MNKSTNAIGKETGVESKVVNYKGEVLEVKDLAKVGGSIACELVDVEVAAITTDGWGGQNAVKLPKLIIITNIQESPLGKKYCLVSYLPYLGRSQFKSSRVNTPSTFKVKMLTGQQSKKMLDAYTKFEFDNLHQNLGHDFAVGSLPEIFIENSEGKIIPSFDFLGQKTENKTITPQKCYVYASGTRVKFDTIAGSCLSYHVDSIQSGLETAYKAAKNHNANARPSLKNVMEIPSDVLNNATLENLFVNDVASNNIYGMKCIEVSPRELPFRSVGGQLHFGVGKTKSDEQIKQMVRALDAILSVCCVSLFAKYDNPIGRQYRGLVGEYRITKYGFEYRALSNTWLCHPMITLLVMELARKCVVFGDKGLLKYWQTSEEEVINCVQNGNVDLAHQIMERNRDTLLKIFRAAYNYLPENQLNDAYQIFYNGIDFTIKNASDLVSNWKLNGGWVTHNGAANASCNNGNRLNKG